MKTSAPSKLILLRGPYTVSMRGLFNIGIPINNYLPYTLESVEDGRSIAMVKLSGMGLLSNYQTSNTQSERIDLNITQDSILGENVFHSAIFSGISFSGEINIDLSEVSTVTFNNCLFAEGTKIKICGSADSINFVGNYFEAYSTIDLSELNVGSEPYAVDSTGDDTAEFIMPNNLPNRSSGWKLTVAAIGLVGLASVLKKGLDQGKVSKEKEKEEVVYVNK